MGNNFNDLFNPQVAAPEVKKNTNEYKPNANGGTNGVYTALVRFVPYWANVSKSIMSKLQAFVKNPLTNSGMYVDDPRSGGQADSPVNKMYWNLVNTKQDNLVKLANECLSTKQAFASLIQVIQDNHHPELNGKILVLRYGKKVYDKIMAESNPPMEGMTARKPFDPIHGRFFLMKVVLQSGFNNYDQCMFVDAENSGIRFINPVTNQYEVVTDASDKNAFIEFLKANSPDLNSYDYQPWTDAVQTHVNATLQVISNYVTTGTMGQNMAAATPTMTQPAAPTMPQGVMFGGATPAVTPNITAAPVTPAAPTFEMPIMPSVATPTASSAAPAAPAAPLVTGLDIPNVASPLPKVEPVAPTVGSAPVFGDLSSVLNNI